MMGQSFFDLFLDFFKFLRKEKLSTEFFPKREEYHQINKYDLQCQLYLIKNISTLKKEIFKNNGLKTRHYEFAWEVEPFESEIYKIKMMSKSRFEKKPRTDYFYIIYSEEYKFLLPIGYVESKFLKKRVTSFLEYFFPNISMSFLSQNEIKEFLSKYLNPSHFKTELKMLVYRKVRKTQGLEKKQIQKAIDYIGAELFTKISTLENEKKYIDTIGLFVYDLKENKLVKFQYNRYNRILWNGNPRYLIEILNRIYKITIKKFEFLDKRERKYTENHRSRPFILKLNNELFSNKENIKIFQNKIRNFPKCSYAIIHSGNPLIHIILRDQNDNSVYSIKNLSNRDLMICPQILGSNSSLLRILDLMSERFSEFEIIDYDQYRTEFNEALIESKA